MSLYVVLLVLGLGIFFGRRKLYPEPYPGIPFINASKLRLGGDMVALLSAIKATDEVTDSMFAVTTRKLMTPVAQVIFPRFRKPLIVIDDPYEVEDIITRRHHEFDKSPMGVDIFAPMFPRGTLSQFTTPELKAQKRLWADAMNVNFLRQTVAPMIFESIMDLVDLWKLKASEKAFNVHDDLKNASLDAIWSALVGEKPGITRHYINQLQNRLSGLKSPVAPSPRGVFVKAEVAYITETIARNSRSPMPTWSQRLETYTLRHRRFRKTVIKEISRAMALASDRLQRNGIASCMMDLVLRRRVVEAEKAGKITSDPATDQNMLDEMFVILVGGYDSSASAIAWFIKFMEAFPAAQNELRSVLQKAFPKPPSVSDILGTEVPYLDAACEESLRLAGTSKGNLRQAVIETEILGYKIPKGADVLLNMHINRPPYLIDDSKRSTSCRAAIVKHQNGFLGVAGHRLHVFEPRRWLVRDQATGKDTFDAYALPSLSFGGGYRGCFGRKLASMEFRIAVVLLILNFEFLGLPEEYRDMRASESIFRRPQKPFAKIQVNCF